MKLEFLSSNSKLGNIIMAYRLANQKFE
jgi:hypothetical protein